MEREVALVKTDQSVIPQDVNEATGLVMNAEVKTKDELLPLSRPRVTQNTAWSLPSRHSRALHRSITAFDYWLTVCGKRQGTKRSCSSHLPPRCFHQDKLHSSPFTSHRGTCSRAIVPSRPPNNLAGRLLFLMSRRWKKTIFQFDWVVLMRTCRKKPSGLIFGSLCLFYRIRHLGTRWMNYRVWWKKEVKWFGGKCEAERFMEHGNKYLSYSKHINVT